MLSLSELHKILKDNNINTEDFCPKAICEIYNAKIDSDKILPLIEEMVLATVDFDTPLYDVLAYANDIEQGLNLDENTTFVCDILNIVLVNMPVCKQNAERLMDLIEDADILDAYNILLEDYTDFLSPKQLDILKALGAKTFDSGLIV